MRLIELDFDTTPEHVDALRTKLAEVRSEITAAGARGAVVRPTIVVTPLGLEKKAELAAHLASIGVHVTARRSVAGWAALSTLLQVTWDDAFGLEKACAFEALWRHLHPGDVCECWELASMDDFLRFQAAKAGMREGFGAEHVHVVTRRYGFRAKLHPFHSPEPARVSAESAWLDHVVPGRR